MKGSAADQLCDPEQVLSRSGPRFPHLTWPGSVLPAQCCRSVSLSNTPAASPRSGAAGNAHLTALSWLGAGRGVKWKEPGIGT